jgi:Na+/proline symporter
MWWRRQNKMWIRKALIVGNVVALLTAHFNLSVTDLTFWNILLQFLLGIVFSVVVYYWPDRKIEQ